MSHSFFVDVGVVSETVTGDVAPSNRVSQERLLDSEDPNLRLRAAACTQCNVQTHAWVAGNLGANDTIYGDVRIDNQRDYYRGTLASEGALGLRYKPIQLNQTDLPNGTYLHSQQYSDDLDGFAIGYKFFFFEKNMSAFTDGSRLYSSGYSAVYYENREDEVPPFTGNETLGG
ncbi:hypothetical protein GJ629_00755 [Halapricum sp. CBA1109]|uniref:hypothetical protein n=1 Tax=Halapricum sp. CBA1109 TaxID=2668068 RepID=UPI0012F9F14E|nr:hypothetical protein [Halapricum sp. CBA1109]MUV88598.1 hypothetical protein [Halapricum sp. CBA1109]